MMSNKKIIVVGATGRVGREILNILLEHNVSSENIECAASAKSVGITIAYGNDKLKVLNLENIDFSNYQVGLFSAGSAVSEIYATKAADAGCIIIDNTSHFRMFDDVSLVVPEINFHDYNKYKNKYIIANPNCSTIQMVMALKPLHDLFALKEVVASTYQSVSGAGQKGISELQSQTESIVKNNKNIEINHFKKQIAFNVIPQIDSFTSSLYTKEEIKMMNETRKILDIPELTITATCVRVPVYVGHAVSVLAKFEKPVDLLEAIDALNNFPGVCVSDIDDEYNYSTPLDSASRDGVFVSRMRIHPDIPNALSFWCVSDNLRKGAALNSVQIAKRLNMF